MWKQDVHFAQRKFSQNNLITRQESVAKMNSHSSKRKREVEQLLIHKSATSVYKELGMGVLTSPITTRDSVEVEPPTKRFQTGTDKTALKNPYFNCTMDRGVLSMATPMLTNEQVQQFTKSTVVSQNPTTVKAGSACSSSSWFQCTTNGRPIQRDISAIVNQQNEWISASANSVLMQNKVPQLPSQQPEQPFATLYGQMQQYMHMQLVYMDYSAMGGRLLHNSSTTEEQNNFAVDQTKTQNGKRKSAGVHKYKQKMSVDKTNQQTAEQVIPKSNRVLKKARRQRPTANNKQPTAQLASTTHLSNNLLQNYPQACQSDLVYGACRLNPQPVPGYVKPAVVQTTSKKSQTPHSKNVSQQLAEVARKGCKKGAKKVKLDTVPNHSTDSQQRETTLSQTDESSTKKAHGMKNTEQGFAPPKPVDYPPYVHRIMRILSRAEQRSETETKKENDNALSKRSSQEWGSRDHV